MPKYLDISQLLERRIEHGDYLTREFPTDRDLAEELSVNPRTVRKAVQRLVKNGLLVRPSGGRPRVERVATNQVRAKRIAFLAVAYPSPHIEQWHQAVEVAAMRGGHHVRMIGYSHVNDPVILDTVANFDCTFIMAAGEVLDDGVLKRIAKSNRPVVFINQDVSRFKMPSLWLASPAQVQALFQHLNDLGHKNIDCFNMQPVGDVITERIEQWRLWSSIHRGGGELVNHPVAPFGSVRAQAYEITKQRIGSGSYDAGRGASAIFSTTFDAAVGAMRAFHEAGIEVGKDISVCAADDSSGLAPYMTPSVTSLRDADPVPYVAACIDWMVKGGGEWMGPLIVQPAAVQIFAGESTGLNKTRTPGPVD